MARIRSIKPEFFAHEELFDLEASCGLPVRLAFAGLWTVADREGRFKWRPRTIKKDVLPYDDVDFAAVLNALEGAGFVRRYVVDGEEYGLIPAFHKHQHINTREAQSTIPAPPGACTEMHVHARGEGKGREGSKEGETEANASGGEPPVVEDVDWLFGDGLSWLTGKGEPERNARSLIGKWRKIHGDDATRRTLEAAMAENPIEPVSWITAAMQQQRGRQRDGPPEQRWAI